jgi:hypothetical protein
MRLLATALGVAALVRAHGYVDNATINGVYYQVSACPPLANRYWAVVNTSAVLSAIFRPILLNTSR